MELGSYCHVVSSTNLKKFDSVAPVRNITKPRFQCMIKKYFGQFWAKIGKIGQNLFNPNWPKFFFYYAKWVWGTNFTL